MEAKTLRRFGTAAAATIGLYVFAIRRWHQRWGATVTEAAAAMAGDDLITHPNWRATRAIAIDAPPSSVWPWLVQMGYRRGGLYSYDTLDRMLGVLDRPSADRILPEFQHLSAGDTIPIRNDPGWLVVEIEKDRVLVLDIRRPRLHITWSFLLTPADGGTRLILRYRGLVRPRYSELPFYAFLDLAEFIMTRRMLLGIRTRAERT